MRTNEALWDRIFGIALGLVALAAGSTVGRLKG